LRLNLTLPEYSCAILKSISELIQIFLERRKWAAAYFLLAPAAAAQRTINYIQVFIRPSFPINKERRLFVINNSGE
jgi:hypothetical protein